MALLILGGCVWFGFSLLRLCGVRLTPEERAVAGPVVGLATGFFLLYLLASSAGGLSGGVLVSGLGIFALAGLAARRRPRVSWGRPAGWFGWLALSIGGVLLFLNLHGVLAPGPRGSVLAGEHVWADLPFHASIITSFAYRDNFPPTYPLALGEPLGYPFLVDFASGVLLRAGWSLRWSVIAVNLLLQLGAFLAVALLTLRLTGSRRAAVLGAVVLLGLGNLGVLAVPRDVARAGGLGRWISALPWSYTGDALGTPGRQRLGTGLYLGNPTFIYLLPRRSAAFGLAVGAVLLLLLEDLLERRGAGPAVLAGLVVGVLPRVHAHTLMAILAFALVWFALVPARKGLPRGRAWLREWGEALPACALATAVALAVALPQVAAMSRQTRGFVSWFWGWTGEPHEALAKVASAHGAERGAAVGEAVTALVRFWVLNGGVLVFLLWPALRRGGRALRTWYAPFAVLWVFANLVRTQPWEWDNNNFFVYWQLGTTVVVAAWLAPLLGEAPWRVPRSAPDRLRRAARPLAGGLLALSLTLGGALSLTYWCQHRFQLWTREDERLAAWVRDHTPPDAVVLTSNGHEHPVIALSGRQTFMGFAGWFVSHGLDWARFEDRLVRMYRGDVPLMRALGVDYVVVGPWERGLAAEKRFELPAVFEDPRVFRVVHRERISGQEWKVLRLLPG